MRVNCQEIVEVALQGSSLLKSGTDDDALIFIAAASLLAANCFSVPLVHCKRWPSAIVIVDACFDTAFAILNTARFIKRDESLDAVGVLSICYPLISISQLLADYAQYRVAMKASQTRRKKLNRGSSLLRLPSMKFYGKRSFERRLYTALMVLLIASCVSFGGISLAMLTKTSSMHMQCAETFDSCLWRSAWPRKYSKESGTLGHFTCNEHLVERIDARFCDISRLATSFDTFESLVEVRGLNALPEHLIRYLASPNCSVKVVELSGKLPNVLNFSGLGMRLLPSVLKATFENHRDDIVTTLDLSSNNFGKAAIEDILRALGCPKEDGVSSALCGYLESIMLLLEMDVDLASSSEMDVA